jgi:hypothetical protein
MSLCERGKDYEIKKFSELDLSKVNFKQDQTYTFGRGGYGLLDSEWYLSHLLVSEHDSFTCDYYTEVYPLPACLNYIINTIYEQGRSDFRLQLKSLIGA